MAKRQTEMVLANRFEAAGMGTAPYRFVGMHESVFNNGDGTTKPGSSCDYCSTAIRYVFVIESADGRQHKVGCECVRHTGDKGLVERATREQKNIDNAKRHAREEKKLAELRIWLEENRELLGTLPHPDKRFADRGQMLSDYVDWYQLNAGMSGKTSSIQFAQRLLEKTLITQ